MSEFAKVVVTAIIFEATTFHMYLVEAANVLLGVYVVEVVS